MYLIDTSVWIDYLREIDNPPVRLFMTILDQGTIFGLTGIIYQEVLQGAASPRDFEYLVEYLGTQRFFQLEDELLGHQAAAEIYFKCRRKGITVRSTIDCLIAQIAIENNLTVLHNDTDFLYMATVIPELKQYSGKIMSTGYKVQEP